MLIIKPIQEKEEQKTLCAACGSPFLPDAMAYAARVDGVLVGTCQFSMDDECGHILTIAKAIGTDDNEALFIMGRQTLNFIDLCGVHFADIAKDDAFDEHLARWIGFRPDETGRFTMDLGGFFESPCHHAAPNE